MAAEPKTACAPQKTVALMSLGCKVNQTENESVAELFRENGYIIVEVSEHPRVLIINTCTVTAAAAGKSRRLIRRIVREHPDSVVAVMGCYSQLEAEIVRSMGAHVIIGTQERRSLVCHVEDIMNKGDSGSICHVFSYSKAAKEMTINNKGMAEISFEELPRLQQEKHVRATVKIQDGCNQLCSYCIVPMSRGPSRSRQPEQVLEEIKSLLTWGYKEIVLAGIHLGCYGHDRSQSLAELIRQITGIPGLCRLRLSSIESTDIDADLLEVLSSHKDIICPHFHIPLQSGSDKVLTRMSRPYGCADYLRVLQEVRYSFPDAAVTTDIMAGFPGETETDAKQTLEMIKECGFADVHAFGFSPRPGTAAAGMPEQITPGVKELRVKALIEAGQKSRTAYLERFIEQTMEVLWERVDSTGAYGHTRNYIHVVVPPSHCDKTWHSGNTAEVRLTPSFITKQE